MQPETRDWLEGLRASLRDRRANRARGVAHDAAAAAAERTILAAHLATWLDAAPHLLEARRESARGGRQHADPDPAIVITTSPLGITVAEELLAGDSPLARDLHPRVACATESEYRAWCMRHPDDAHHLHLNHWSWIKTRVPPQRHHEFARHPLRPGESYWLHRAGTAGAGAADGREAHLWKFDGRHAALLEAFVPEARVAPRTATTDYSSTHDRQPP